MSVKGVVLGGGCFWCMEAVFQLVDGVVSVEPGYSGGHLQNPSYEDVCTDKTGHAEVVMVKFDDSIVDLSGILEVFFSSHDPTSLNKQGGDIGTQYRSAIFYLEDEQLPVIESYVNHLIEEKKYRKPIVTQIEKLDKFYPAEDYHHNYFKNNPEKGYCRLVIQPKVEKVKNKLSVGKIKLKL